MDFLAELLIDGAADAADHLINKKVNDYITRKKNKEELTCQSKV